MRDCILTGPLGVSVPGCGCLNFKGQDLSNQAGSNKSKAGRRRWQMALHGLRMNKIGGVAGPWRVLYVTGPGPTPGIAAVGRCSARANIYCKRPMRPQIRPLGPASTPARRQRYRGRPYCDDGTRLRLFTGAVLKRSFIVRDLTRPRRFAGAADSGAAGQKACNVHGSDHDQIHRHNLSCS
jgi:hypothetical protein